MKILCFLLTFLGLASANILQDLSLLGAAQTSYWRDSVVYWSHTPIPCDTSIHDTIIDETTFVRRQPAAKETLMVDHYFWWLAVTIPVDIEGIRRSLVLKFPMRESAQSETIRLGGNP